MKKINLLPILSFFVAILLTAALCGLSLVGQSMMPPPTVRQVLNRQGTWIDNKEFLQLAAIDLNTASIAQLQELPGIGPVLSQRIVDYRSEHGYITDIDKLDDIHGIGEVTMRTLHERGYIVSLNTDNQ